MTTINMKKIAIGTLSTLALAVTLGLAAPQAAEARIVCHGGWGWHSGHCVRVHHVHYMPHRHHYHHGYYR